MQVKQVAEFVNQALGESVGSTALVNEDLSGIVDAGVAVFNANAVDNYVRSLVDHIGRVIFVDRAYRGRAPKVVMDAWEYGSVLEKVSMETPDAVENPTWDLQDGEVYEQDTFTKPVITVKFYNHKTTFEVPISITDKQVKESFSSAYQLSGFISMIYTTIENSLTRAMDALVMRAILNITADTLAETSEGATYIRVAPNAINLHAVWLQSLSNPTPYITYTFQQALHEPSFLRVAGETIRKTLKRMGVMSKLFNLGGKDRFTPAEDMHLVLLTDFVSATATYLESDTFHNELIKLPNYEEIPYWQGTGTNYGQNAIIKVKSTNGTDLDRYSEPISLVGVAFDRNAVGVANWDRRTTAHRNNHAEFENLWFKNDAGFFNDGNENFVAFYYTTTI